MKKTIALILTAVITLSVLAAASVVGVGAAGVNDRYATSVAKVNSHMILPITLACVAVGLLIAIVVYIFIEAPKCGMSRLWAIVPLFSQIIGLIIFLVIRESCRSNRRKENTFRCPTCSSVHPVGTAFCSVCGTNFTSGIYNGGGSNASSGAGAGLRCPNCGAVNPAGMQFCPNCGGKMN